MVNFVAKQLDVVPQMVQDKYCHQLQLTVSELDKLLNQGYLTKLHRLLIFIFFRHTEVIDYVLDSINGS